MRRQNSLWRLALASVWLLVLAVAVSAQSAEVYFRAASTLTETRLDANSPTTTRGKLPVLFVHGHNLLSPNDVIRNYRNNWQDRLGNLPSFLETLNLSNNAGLGIEDYYIRFRPQGRSIADDAAEISDAIELILHRHDPNYAYPRNPAQTTPVQVVIIAYSKGTISTRLYLKNLAAEQRRFRPVSEFIAIAPPNHGINGSLGGNSTASQQLMNGRDEACTSFGNATEDFIATLNGHAIGHTAFDPANPTATPLDYPSEAPDSRAPSERIIDGILYVTLFADQNRDFVGGDTILAPPNNDCEGRRLALNLSLDAVNIPVAEVSNNSNIPLVPDGSPSAVHQNTVHTPEVICLALYAAVHHRSPRGQTCAQATGGVPIIPPPPAPPRAAAMLVLDFSGSMSALACPGCTNTRADVLKESVELFVQLWSTVSVPSDRLGVIYFRSNVEQFHHPASGETLPLLSAGSVDIISDVNAQAPNRLTAMGGALWQAIQTLNGVAANTPIRRVILFTDGMQNVNPVVQTVGSQLVIADRPSPPAVALAVLDTRLGIPVDTIGIGAGTTFVAMLEDIADETGGESKATVDTNLLHQFFVEALINALRGFSPQLVAYRRGVVAARGSTEAFTIEDGGRKLVLKVSWKRGDSLDFSVVRDGVDVTSAGRFINGAFYKIFVVDLPATGQLAARGNWQLRINGKADTAYEVAAIIDGSQIAYDARFDAGQPKAGDPLDLVVRLTAGGQPVSGNTRVSVTLTSPTTAPGDIIANTQLKELPGLEPGTTLAERQLLSLTQDPKRFAALKPRQQKLVMQSNDKGEFRTRLNPQVPGIYTAFVAIDGEDAKIGRFSRTLTATTVVRFANADLKASDLFTSECRDGGRRYVRLVLSPRDARGQRLGPGSSSAISLSLSAGRTVGGTRDLGDGSYMMLLAVAPGDDPTIKLEVAGGTLFSGRLSQLTEEASR